MTHPTRTGQPNVALTPPTPGGVLTLAIENSNPGSVTGAGDLGPASVALGWTDNGVATLIESEPISESSRTEDDLISAIARCCDRAAIERSSIRLVGVDIGPGGYTALRMAVAAAKMIAMVNGASCVGVPAAEVCFEATCGWGSSDDPHVSGRSLLPERPAIVVLATKGATAFVTRPPDPSPGRVMTWDEVRSLPRFAESMILMDEHAPKGWHDDARSLGAIVQAPQFGAVALLRCVARHAAIGPVAGASELFPLYAREPEAVTIWRERKANAKP